MIRKSRGESGDKVEVVAGSICVTPYRMLK